MTVYIGTFFCQPIETDCITKKKLETMITIWTKETVENGVCKLLQYVNYKRLNKLVIRELDRVTGEPIDIVKVVHYL